MQIRVYYEDTDTGGVVYHSNYLNFCERARSEAFFKKNMTPVLENGHFVARKVTADFYKSAKLGDMLEIYTKLVTMKAASFTLSQEIYKENEKIFELEILLVYIDFDGKVQKLDNESKELILSLF
ncbi:YbgC/FadM family acyl-CoA thioesterase [Sulfurimonas hydrogeniphila]|uniref:YbgC/FadM family acyl-CoA thioesterase n=1 Tax=Sulfurimonas hydrogeniphila TaxID=2509341 RepID=UPI00125EF0D9|nr:YbgC/FadM family acyl-CoA thioesterase [Sulfurimonas hydrogeniphila]